MELDESEDSRTIFIGNLSEKVTEELLYELFLQAGPLEKVRIPNDREGRQAAYGFVTYKHQCSVKYALNVFEGIFLFKNRLNLKPRNLNSQTVTNQVPQNMNFNNSNIKWSPVHIRTPSGRHEGRNEHYRNESLQGRWNNYSQKRDRDMRPIENHRHNYKRHKR